ncbi:Response regulator PleD [Fundidesulfovibrio magnetotacticus]|uniref:diguanylate cyclase n=1 Tax=Fundidesulfovibrio magnetotacticus TaxID=2730080 RepID=A0A6V8LUQ7_9BACT|nr:diguanylate cyclase [Fundidesulfovibrio magnetotacticus]GFK94048.1 Response regulator PleD [Fundidesulfovibrio magnetotacticus]
MASILVVDDSKTFGSLLRRLVEKETGIGCVWAKSLAECKAALEEASGPFVAALLDLNLPDAPEGEVVDLVLAHAIPSIVFTGELSEELRGKVWSRRIVDYVRKEGAHNLRYVARLLKRLVRNKGLKALVVDDSALARAAARRLLDAHGYLVFEAGGGAQALKLLEKEPDIRLAVIDYFMPDMNGAELTTALRERLGFEDAAIIGVSAEGDMSTSVSFLKSGANDFIHKPFQAEEFYCRVAQNVDMLNMFEDIREMANRDFLTGLANRKHLFETGKKLFASQRRGHLRLSAAMMDLDHFKRVNDTFGHDAGDAVLRHFASVLKERFRETDILARFGGEEFCVLSVNMDPAKAFDIFDAFRREVAAKPVLHGGREIPCSVSVGVAVGPGAGFEELLKASDELLYRSKAEGRNRVTVG